MGRYQFGAQIMRAYLILAVSILRKIVLFALKAEAPQELRQKNMRQISG